MLAEGQPQLGFYLFNKKYKLYFYFYIILNLFRLQSMCGSREVLLIG